ncbi:MAG: hypothetical protein IJ411_04930, partial [Oscillospiraceae bacterium]|nr:hypothetical protein [Oscillospiraceae bacterium]
KLGFTEERTVETVSPEAAVVETAEEAYMDEELHKIANTYGEIFGLLVTEGKASLVEDKYCADELYEVQYDGGEVQVNTNTKSLYWFKRSNVKTDEIKLTERQLVSKAKEYFNILQLDRDYGNIARKVDREKNTATVIFQRIVDEELELYSDYEAVKMVLSAQTGELMSCKIFNLPLVEQEGQKIGQAAAAAAVQDQLSITFATKAEGELAICSPIIWGDEANYTSRIVWKITADDTLYYVDAYSGTVLGSRSL